MSFLLALPTELLTIIAWYLSIPIRYEGRRLLQRNLSLASKTCRRLHAIITPFLHATIAASPSSVMSFAIHRNYPSTARLAISQGAQLTGFIGGEYLAIATHLRANDVTLALLEAGAKPIGAAMRNAIMADNPVIVKALLDHGFGLDEGCYEGKRPLWWASNRRCPKALRVILDAGGCAVPSRVSPLTTAIDTGWMEGVKMLLEAGIDPNGRSWGRVSSLDCARRSRWNAKEMVELLLKYGAVEDPK